MSSLKKHIFRFQMFFRQWDNLQLCTPTKTTLTAVAVPRFVSKRNSFIEIFWGNRETTTFWSPFQISQCVISVIMWNVSLFCDTQFCMAKGWACSIQQNQVPWIPWRMAHTWQLFVDKKDLITRLGRKHLAPHTRNLKKVSQGCATPQEAKERENWNYHSCYLCG